MQFAPNLSSLFMIFPIFDGRNGCSHAGVKRPEPHMINVLFMLEDPAPKPWSLPFADANKKQLFAPLIRTLPAKKGISEFGHAFFANS
jgi:hypothetical protein